MTADDIFKYDSSFIVCFTSLIILIIIIIKIHETNSLPDLRATIITPYVLTLAWKEDIRPNSPWSSCPCPVRSFFALILLFIWVVLRNGIIVLHLTQLPKGTDTHSLISYVAQQNLKKIWIGLLLSNITYWSVQLFGRWFNQNVIGKHCLFIKGRQNMSLIVENQYKSITMSNILNIFIFCIVWYWYDKL